MQSGTLQIALRLGPGKFGLGQIQRAGGVAQFGLGPGQIGAGDGDIGFGPGRVDPEQELPRFDLTAVFEPVRQFDDTACCGGPQFQHATGANLAEGGQDGGDGLRCGGQYVGGQHTFARRTAAAITRLSRLECGKRDLCGPAQKADRQGQQEERHKAASEKAHSISDLRCVDLKIRFSRSLPTHTFVEPGSVARSDHFLRKCSSSRGMISTKLQGLCLKSSW